MEVINSFKCSLHVQHSPRLIEIRYIIVIVSVMIFILDFNADYHSGRACS